MIIMTKTISIAEFIKNRGLSMTFTPAPENPHMADDANERVKMNHWACMLEASGQQMVVYFSKGDGLRVWKATSRTIGGRVKGTRAAMPLKRTVAWEQDTMPEPPSLIEVLDCLAMDANGIENASSFEDWCGEYGYDTDSRKAEKTYRICARQVEKLRAMLGREAYEELLYGVERE
jgi:hypothetical protein